MSVKDFLGVTTLVEALHLPLPMQAHEEVRHLQQLVANVGSGNDLEAKDTWSYVWGSKEFNARKYYKFYFKDVKAHKTYRSLWKSKVTMKIKIFRWLLLSHRLNTRNMLKRRHYNIRDDLDCLLCGQQIEEDIPPIQYDLLDEKWTRLGKSEQALLLARHCKNHLREAHVHGDILASILEHLEGKK